MKKQIAVLCPSMKEAEKQCDNLRRVMKKRHPDILFVRLNSISLESDFCVVRFYSEQSINLSCYLQGIRFDLMIGFKAGVIMDRANSNCEVILKYDEDAVVDQIIDYIERNEGEKSMRDTLLIRDILTARVNHCERKIKEVFDKYDQVGLRYHIYHKDIDGTRDYVMIDVSFSFKYPDGSLDGITFAKTVFTNNCFSIIDTWVCYKMFNKLNAQFALRKRLADLNNPPMYTIDVDIASLYPSIHHLFLNKQFILPKNRQSIPGIEKVTFNDPATIVFWNDGTKTIVQARNGEKFDPEKGLAMAISKKALGNTHDYYETFLKEVGRYEKKQTKAKTKKAASKSKKQGDK